MITKANDAEDALALINENLEKMIKKERSIPMAKEVHNSVGKMTNVVKTQLIQKMWLGDKTPIEWLLGKHQKQLYNPDSDK